VFDNVRAVRHCVTVPYDETLWVVLHLPPQKFVDCLVRTFLLRKAGLVLFLAADLLTKEKRSMFVGLVTELGVPVGFPAYGYVAKHEHHGNQESE